MTTYIVCEYADAPLTVAGAVFDKKCSVCGAALMLAPTGQECLRTHPDAKLVCILCLPNRPVTGVSHTGTPEQLAAELKTVQPNLRRSRN